MNSLLRTNILIFSLLCINTLNASFLLKMNEKAAPKKSKRVLKEDIGDELQEVMKITNNLQQRIAQLQLSLSTLQSDLLSCGQDVLCNSGSVKASSKKELGVGLKTLQETSRDLHKQVVTISRLQKKVRGTAIVSKGKA